MKYYSEILGKNFDTVGELEKAEELASANEKLSLDEIVSKIIDADLAHSKYAKKADNEIDKISDLLVEYNERRGDCDKLIKKLENAGCSETVSKCARVASLMQALV